MIDNEDNNSLIEETISEGRVPFRIFQLKYTMYHFNTGFKSKGTPITTSIELVNDMSENKWKMNVIHKYVLENADGQASITKQYDLQDQEKTLQMLESNDLRNLKNNYFSDNQLERYSHWELEYNNYFKISGTFDKEPEEVKNIVDILGFNDIIDEVLKRVLEMVSKEE